MAHDVASEPQPTQIVGSRRVRRVDAIDKVSGAAQFGSDLNRMPGLLHAKLLLSERPHAVIESIDTSAARQMPGVRAIITGADFGGGLMGFGIMDQAAMANERTTYYGEPIAAVAADSEELAEEALEHIHITYRDLPVILDPEAALREDSHTIHPGKAGYRVLGGPPNAYPGNVITVLKIESGDVDAAFRGAFRVYTHEYRTQVSHHGYIEPHVAYADWDQLGNKLTIWSPSQGPYMLRSKLAGLLKLPESRLRVIGTYVGGGFGGKVDAHIEPVAALLSKLTGRPVKGVASREVDFLSTFTRGETIIRLRTAVDEEGSLLARDGWVLLGSGAFAGLAPLELTSIIQVLAGPYRIPHVRLEGLTVYTNKQNSQMVRGPGGAQGAFAGETQLDVIARDFGIDPLEYRRRHAAQTGDKNYQGVELHHVAFSAALDQAAARVEALPDLEPLAPHVVRGRGMAVAEWHSGAGGSSAYVKLSSDGSAQVLTGANEIGGGEATVVALLVAEELGLTVEDVTVNAVDTDISPYDPVVAGSRATHTMGAAVRAAAQDVRRQLLDMAALQLEADRDDLVIENKTIFVRGTPDKALPIAAVAGRAAFATGPIQGSGAVNIAGFPCDPTFVKEGFVGGAQAHTYAVQFADVDVDTRTGQVTVRRLVAANDVGKAINPVGVEGQIEGGAAMGIGYGLTEEMHYSADGRLLNPNLLDYKMVTSMDTPAIEAVLVEVFDPYGGPHGAKGVGEPPILPTAAAITNAILDATGVLITTLPLTPERVLASLRSAEAGHPAD